MIRLISCLLTLAALRLCPLDSYCHEAVPPDLVEVQQLVSNITLIGLAHSWEIEIRVFGIFPLTFDFKNVEDDVTSPILNGLVETFSSGSTYVVYSADLYYFSDSYRPGDSKRIPQKLYEELLTELNTGKQDLSEDDRLYLFYFCPHINVYFAPSSSSLVYLLKIRLLELNGAHTANEDLEWLDLFILKSPKDMKFNIFRNEERIKLPEDFLKYLEGITRNSGKFGDSGAVEKGPLECRFTLPSSHMGTVSGTESGDRIEMDIFR